MNRSATLAALIQSDNPSPVTMKVAQETEVEAELKMPRVVPSQSRLPMDMPLEPAKVGVQRIVPAPRPMSCPQPEIRQVGVERIEFRRASNPRQ